VQLKDKEYISLEMMKAPEPAMYFLNKTGYHGVYPPFHNKAEHAWAKIIEENWMVIRDELYAHSGFRSFVAPHVSISAGWKGFYLLNYGWIKPDFYKKFPNTAALLENVPNLTFAAFSLLEPGAELLPHFGDTNTIIRCAMGIEVPAEAPVCALQVGNEIRSWKEGEILMFSECHKHAAWNKSDRRRIVFSFDFMLPAYRSSKNVICSRVLAAETLAYLNNNFRFFTSISRNFYMLFYWAITALWFIYLPLQRIFWSVSWSLRRHSVKVNLKSGANI
jgi:hypothetical protein